MSRLQNIVIADLLIKIKQIINASRFKLAQTINSELILTYWEIEKAIVEKEESNNFDNKSSRQIILEISRRCLDICLGHSVLDIINYES